jgi:two-component system, LytTR family, response regulator
VPHRLTALIVDDEPVSRDLLRAMLNESGRIEVLGEARNVAEAITAISEGAPDLVFLDIQMPDGTGFDVISAVGVESMPVVVFVTAYDEYAVKAFEVMALDYLLKPFDEERLHESLERALARVESQEDTQERQLLAMMQDLRSSGRGEYADRLAVDTETHLEVIRTDDVNWLEAKGKHVLVHTTAATYLLREGLTSLTARLDPKDFLRVHRSAVVRLDRVKEVHRWYRGDYRLVLNDGTRLDTGMTYKKAVEARLMGGRRPPIA